MAVRESGVPICMLSIHGSLFFSEPRLDEPRLGFPNDDPNGRKIQKTSRNHISLGIDQGGFGAPASNLIHNRHACGS